MFFKHRAYQFDWIEILDFTWARRKFLKPITKMLTEWIIDTVANNYFLTLSISWDYHKIHLKELRNCILGIICVRSLSLFSMGGYKSVFSTYAIIKLGFRHSVSLHFVFLYISCLILFWIRCQKTNNHVLFDFVITLYKQSVEIQESSYKKSMLPEMFWISLKNSFKKKNVKQSQKWNCELPAVVSYKWCELQAEHTTALFWNFGITIVLLLPKQQNISLLGLFESSLHF